MHGILGIGVGVAHGRMFRIAALKGAKHSVPRTAAMAATEWRAGANRTCREGAAWRSIWTDRGGWQGARSALLLSPMTIEAVDNTQVMACRDITRVGLQDDMCAIAKPEKLTKMLEDCAAGMWTSTENA